MAIGERLKALRESAGMTQEALARAAGLAVSTVAKIEHSGIDPAWSTVVRLARGLGVSVAAFDDGDPGAATGKPAKGKKGKGK